MTLSEQEMLSYASSFSSVKTASTCVFQTAFPLKPAILHVTQGTWSPQLCAAAPLRLLERRVGLLGKREEAGHAFAFQISSKGFSV